MKKILLSIVALLAFNMVTYAQADVTKYINTARNHLQNYVQDEMTQGKTKSLEKAREAIDEATKRVKEKQAAKDSKLKSKNVAKTWTYRAQVYGELAGLEGNPLAEGAKAQAVEAASKAIAADPKADRDKNNMVLDQMRINDYNAGADNFKEKDYAAAYESFKSSLEIFEVMNTGSKEVIDTPTIAMVAYSAQNAGKSDDAQKYLERLVELDYQDETVYTALSGIYMEKGESDKASDIIGKGKERFPGSNAFLINEINILMKSNKQSEAVGKMEEAAKLYPDNASLFFALGSTYETLEGDGMKQKAIDSYKAALEKKPGYFDALYNLGALYYNQAAEKTKAASGLGMSSSDQAKYDVLSKEANDLFKQALPYFEQAETANSNDLNTLIALKEIHANLGDLNKSKEYKTKFEALKK